MKQRAFVMIELGWQQNRLPLRIRESPAWHPKYCGSGASAGDLVRVPRVPGPSRGEAWLAARIREDLGRIAQLLDLLDDAPFETIQIVGKPGICRQANVDTTYYFLSTIANKGFPAHFSYREMWVAKGITSA